MISREIGAAAVGIVAVRGQFLHVVAGARTPARWPRSPRARTAVVAGRCRSSAACSSAISSSDRLLRAAGRLSVSTATPPSWSRAAGSAYAAGGACGQAVMKHPEQISSAGHDASPYCNKRGEARAGRERHDNCENERGRTRGFLHHEFPQAFSGGDISDRERRRYARRLLRQRYSEQHAASGRDGVRPDADGAGGFRDVCGAAVGDRPGRRWRSPPISTSISCARASPARTCLRRPAAQAGQTAGGRRGRRCCRARRPIRSPMSHRPIPFQMLDVFSGNIEP